MQHLSLEIKSENKQKKNNSYIYSKYSRTNDTTFLFQCVFSFTQASLHRVDDVCEAVRVECVGAAAAVKARVDTEYGIVQGL